FESALYAHGGRFAAICFAGGAARCYLDPCGSLAVVFSSAQQIAASTSSLIPYPGDREEDVNRELIAAMGISEERTSYPFGLTPRRSVERLLPNHFLDLETWRAARHWPAGEIAMTGSVQAAVQEVASILKRNISAVARDFPLHMSLTAGRDSRMLLACVRDYVDAVVFFTHTVRGPGGRVDCQVAPKIAKRFGLSHMFLPFEKASEVEVEQWLYRTGHCVHGKIVHWVRSYKRLDQRRAVLIGAAGELGRGYHWRRGDTEATPISADDLLVKVQSAITAQTRDRAQHWLESLPLKNSLTVWGLLYNEDFNGCWFGPVIYGFTHNASCIWPFCHRRVIEIMLSLPAEYRQSNLLPRDVVESLWPELLSLPFNWPMGLQRYIYAVKWRAEKIRKQIARLLGARAPPP
ncbi:MAG: hypothetical protein IMZ62_05640, partial [Chloroflexi bacterium]|nr:hypothetical protein [Chloroflexota bacterium]